MKIAWILAQIMVPNLLWACSCNIGDTPKKFKDHVSIFQGVVTEVIYYNSTDMFGDQHIKVTFDIEKQWKGQKKQNVLHTVNNGMSCYGYWYKKGQRYIIYAFEEGDHLNNWWCGGVIPESETSESFKSEALDLDNLAANHTEE